MRGRERHAIAAAAHFERLSEDSESESAEVKEALLNWAKAEIILRNSEEARGILKEGLDGVGQEGNAGEWRTLLLQTWMGPIRQKLAEREVENAMELLDSAADEVGSSRELIEAAASLASQASEPLRVELNEFYERMRDVAEKTSRWRWHWVRWPSPWNEPKMVWHTSNVPLNWIPIMSSR